MKHLARATPDAELDIESTTLGSNLGGFLSNRLVSKLKEDGFGLQESAYNKRKRDGFKVYTYKDDDVDVDVALVHGGNSVNLANHVRHLRDTLSQDKKDEIIDNKQRLQNAWFFKDTRYKNYKRNVDKELGLTQFHE